MNSGYSNTPLAKKLGIKPGFHILLLDQPKDYFSFFNDFPEDFKMIKQPKKDSLDFIHFFCTKLKVLQQQTPKLKSYLKKEGALWISWPKGSSPLSSEINRDIIRDYLLSEGLVDVKVAAINDDWSGLKFVYRLKDR